MKTSSTIQLQLVAWTDKAGIAEHLDCSERHVSNLMRWHIIPYVKRRRFVRFDKHKVDAAMKKYEMQSVGMQSFAE